MSRPSTTAVTTIRATWCITAIAARSIRYTERLADAGIELSVGRTGDAYDNALAETVIGLVKTEVIRRRGPCPSLEAVEFATLAWVDWFNTRRLGPIGDVPPAEFEAAYYQRTEAAAVNEFALRRPRRFRARSCSIGHTDTSGSITEMFARACGPLGRC
jgi:hypothetical protein